MLLIPGSQQTEKLSPGSQQTENYSNRYDLVDNPFMRSEDTEMIANICSFERTELEFEKHIVKRKFRNQNFLRLNRKRKFRD